MDAISSFLFLPGTCLLCGSRSGRQQDLCAACTVELPWLERGCALCAMPLTEADSVCGSCLKKPPPQSAARAALLYTWPVNTLIQRFKFDGDQACGRVLGELLAQCIARCDGPLPDVLVPVPLHPDRQRERGFNQAYAFAQMLSRTTGVPVKNNLLTRMRATEEQSGKSAIERRRNLRGAFACHAAQRMPASIAVIDDVMTTGTTLGEIARTLKAAGAREVQTWVLARTP
jgi:ComF family protein